jgi:hypothetical protein
VELFRTSERRSSFRTKVKVKVKVEVKIRIKVKIKIEVKIKVKIQIKVQIKVRIDSEGGQNGFLLCGSGYVSAAGGAKPEPVLAALIDLGSSY